MSFPTDIRLRPGRDPRYLNIDVADTEVGHLRLAADGRILSSWAEHLEDRDLLTLVGRCYTAALEVARGEVAP
jgi:hypothetical protein